LRINLELEFRRKFTVESTAFCNSCGDAGTICIGSAFQVDYSSDMEREGACCLGNSPSSISIYLGFCAL
jgi:hypothetical protein